MKKVFLILFIATALSAQNVTNENKTAETSEVIVLRSQLQTMQEYDQKLLTTVYWALGVVGGIAVLLVGYGWFTNWRIYERDKAALTQELESQLQSKFATLKAELATKQNAVAEEILAQASTKVESVRNDLKQEIKQNESFAQQLLERILALSLWIEYYKGQMEANYWEAQKVEGNVLDRYREMLTIAIKVGDEGEITSCLVKLEGLMRKGTLPFWAYVPGLIEILDKLPPKFTTQTNTIKEHLKNVKSS